jgi:arsenate reductase
MREVGIELKGKPKSADLFTSQSFDYVITVCDNAKETCPVFIGRVKHHLHIGFDDPAAATGTEEEVLSIFRQVRDEIRTQFHQFYLDHLRTTRQ